MSSPTRDRNLMDAFPAMPAPTIGMDPEWWSAAKSEGITFKTAQILNAGGQFYGDQWASIVFLSPKGAHVFVILQRHSGATGAYAVEMVRAYMNDPNGTRGLWVFQEPDNWKEQR